MRTENISTPINGTFAAGKGVRRGGRAAAGSHLWAVWLAGAVLATTVYFFLSVSEQSILWDAIGVSAGAAMLLGVRRNQAEPRSAWVLLAFGVLAIAIGDIVYGTYEPVPSLADVFYLSGHAVIGVGLIALLRRNAPDVRRSVVGDAAVIAAAVVVASLLFLGTIHRQGTGLSTQAVSLTYPLTDLISLGLVVRLALTVTRRPAHLWLIGLALMLLLAGDSGYALQGYGNLYSLGSGLDATWLLAYACFGAALLHPAASEFRVRAPSARGQTVPTTVARHDAPAAVQSLRMRRVFRWSGSMALLLAAPTMLAAAALQASDMMFLAGVYGMTGSLMVISSVIHSS